MLTKSKIVAAFLLIATATSPAFASDPTTEQHYANSGQPFSYFGVTPSPLGGEALDAFAQANGKLGGSRPSYTTESARVPTDLQTQRWYDRQSEIY